MSISSWSTAEKDALDRCGHCDNCLRDPASIEKRDVTLVSWQILKIVQEMKKLGKKMTLSQLATLARGKGKSQVEVNTGRGRRKAKEVMDVDLDSVCGGPAQDISANDIERVIVRLLLDGYLEEEFKATSYSINVYLTLGQLKGALVHTRREDIERGASRTKIEMTFVKPETKTRKSKTKATNATGEAKKGSPLKTKTTAQGSNTNGGGKLRQTQLQMRVEEESEQEYIDIYEGLDEDEESDEAYGEDEEEPAPPTRAAQSRKRSHGRGAVEPEVIEVLDSDEIVSPSESEEDDEWLFNQRGKPKPPPKKIRKVESGSSGMQNGRSKVGSGGRGGRRTILSDVDEDEIMVVSSD
ncbi:ATP-dependent DNA helicase [Coprinopsis cinerea AmutBmut pab1-1]|nr:ATP-dependent DNA helicase [Coprinopsis cinerea AmutBmut pab1-1]